MLLSAISGYLHVESGFAAAAQLASFVQIALGGE